MRPWYILATSLCCLLLRCGEGDSLIPSPVNMRYDIGPAYSNDGSRIAYFSFGIRSYPPKPGLYITDTSGINRLFVADWGMHPTWLPGDTEIVFFDLSYNIYLINLNNGIESLLVDLQFSRFTSVTNDRRYLYFDAYRVDSIWTTAVCRLDFLSGKIDTIVSGECPSISPDGKWLAFFRKGVFIYNLDNDSLVQLAPFGEFPCWSPTRDEIAFAYIPPGRGSYDIYITDLLGNRHKIMANGCFPRFSPDGNRIVYDADSNDNLTHIWLMNRDGGGKRQITF